MNSKSSAESGCECRQQASQCIGRPQPGATQGGCCFDGARNALLPIADVAHIVHGPISCTGTSWDTRGSRSSGALLYRTGMTTDLSTFETVMGTGESRLSEAIDLAVRRFSPAAVFIYVTCMPAMLGADVASVARSARQRWQLPVVPIDCAGFYGHKNLGQRIAGKALLDEVIGTAEPPEIPAALTHRGLRTYDVNLIGEWNVGGEFWNVAPLFDELGLRILCTLSGDSRFREVQTMHRARVNMVVCSKALLDLAQGLERGYGTPFFEGSFYGVDNTSQALRSFARQIGDPDLQARSEALIAREEARVAEAIRPLRMQLAGKRALIFSGGFKSWSTVSAVQNLGMTVVATGIEKSTEEDKARIRQLLGKDARMLVNNDQAALIRTFEETHADILLAGDRYIYPALKARLPFLDLDHVRDIGYAGYSGAIELARRIAATITHPVWREVHRPAPWQAPCARAHAA